MPKQRVFFETEDGSKSLFIPEMSEQYHSKFGAVQEAMHVYIENGLKQCKKKKITILELGFGTGLNAALAWNFALENDISIRYISIEKYPLQPDEWVNLLDDNVNASKLAALHSASWNQWITLDQCFSINKLLLDFRNLIQVENSIDVVFYDAFGPDVQPHLWSKDIFQELFQKMESGGVLTTYTAKGQVRRHLKEVGFIPERIPGPPGKREILRAIKP